MVCEICIKELALGTGQKTLPSGAELFDQIIDYLIVSFYNNF